MGPVGWGSNLGKLQVISNKIFFPIVALKYDFSISFLTLSTHHLCTDTHVTVYQGRAVLNQVKKKI